MKIKNLLRGLFLVPLTLVLKISGVKAAGTIKDEPYRLQELEVIFIDALLALWALSIPYFIFTVIYIGAQWMLAFGDEQKLAGLKKRGGNVAIAFGLVFGGYIFVRVMIILLALQDPGNCFTTGFDQFDNMAIFKFFFPGVCTGTV
ncbi:MAG: hypothetical protein ABIE03_07810 [Patescibacteria group bacterium]|nr:hypothetical protein [Patescibacteria group bacterium]